MLWYSRAFPVYWDSISLHHMERNALLRIGLLLLFVVLLIGLKVFTPLGNWLSFQQVEQSVRQAGIAGIVIYIFIYSMGLMMYAPGAIFAIIPLLVYDYPQAAIICYVGTIAAVTSNFYFARLIGGQSLSSLNSKFVQKMLTRLADKPILTVFVLREILLISPPLNYTLALTEVRPFHFLIGSMLGLILPIGTLSLLFFYWQETVMGWFT